MVHYSTKLSSEERWFSLAGGAISGELDEEWIWDIALEFSDTPDYAVGWPVRFMLGSVPDRPSGFDEAPEVLIQLGRWMQGATGVVVEQGRIDRDGSR